MSEKNKTISEPLATIGDRIIAYIIDFFIMQLGAVVIGILILIAWGILLAINAANPEMGDDPYMMVFTIVGVVGGLGWAVFNAYYLIFWPVRHEGQTIGKRFKKIRIMIVEDLESGKIRRVTKDDLGTFLMRLVFSVVDALFFFLVGLYIMNNNPNCQRFADQQAKTVVILDKE